MIIERFHDSDPIPGLRRFSGQGRLAPDGLEYVSSWITHDQSTCYQVMSCEDPALLETWMAAWRDLVDFEVLPVHTSAEVRGMVASRL
jgi:hypothetical protein